MKHLFCKGILLILFISTGPLFARNSDNKCKNQIINFASVLNASTVEQWQLMKEIIDLNLSLYVQRYQRPHYLFSIYKIQDAVRNSTLRLLWHIEKGSIKTLDKYFKSLIVKNCSEESIKALDKSFKISIVNKGSSTNLSFLGIVWRKILEDHRARAHVMYKLLCSTPLYRGVLFLYGSSIVPERVCVKDLVSGSDWILEFPRI